MKQRYTRLTGPEEIPEFDTYITPVMKNLVANLPTFGSDLNRGFRAKIWFVTSLSPENDCDGRSHVGVRVGKDIPVAACNFSDRVVIYLSQIKRLSPKERGKLLLHEGLRNIVESFPWEYRYDRHEVVQDAADFLINSEQAGSEALQEGVALNLRMFYPTASHFRTHQCYVAAYYLKGCKSFNISPDIHYESFQSTKNAFYNRILKKDPYSAYYDIYRHYVVGQLITGAGIYNLSHAIADFIHPETFQSWSGGRRMGCYHFEQQLELMRVANELQNDSTCGSGL